MGVACCRVCGRPLYSQPLLRFANMPRAAQHLPGAEDLAEERGVDLDVFQCSGCGLVQLAGPPVPYYREVIRAAGVSDDMRRFRLTQFRELVGQYGLAGRRLIEIGCGRGEYLSLLTQCGVEAVGLEAGEASAAHCCAQGLNVFTGFVGDARAELPGGPYAGFMMLNFLEHLPDMNGALQGIAHNLEEGGIGLVEVPNFDMVVRKRLFAEFIADHLAYFTKETFGTVLRLNGFEVMDCREIWFDYIISAVVRKRAPTNVGDFRGYQARMTAELAAFFARLSGSKVAVWGAGHQALALLALSGLADRVRYVIDSAPFKQGRFTPATHRPIVSPERLDEDPVDAVIVMAGGYSNEVAGLLQAKYAGRLTVAVVRDTGLETLSAPSAAPSQSKI